MTDVFVWNWTELLGYCGGLILAFALAPQVYHTYRTQSTRDISYGWQGMYLVGLVLSYVYFVLSGVTAAWVTLTLELLMALFLFAMKVHNDGCRGQWMHHSSTKSVEMSVHDLNDVEFGLSDDESGDGMKAKAAWLNGWNLDCDDSGGCHVILNVNDVPDNLIPLKFTDALMTEIERLARTYRITITCPHVDIFNATASTSVDGGPTVTGFAVSALFGHSYLSIFYHSQQEILSLDFNSRRTVPKQTVAVAGLGRTFIRDMVQFLKRHLSSHAKFVVHDVTTGSQPESDLSFNRVGSRFVSMSTLLKGKL